MADYGYQSGMAANAYSEKAAYDSPVEMGPFATAGHAFEDVYALVRRIEALADRLAGSVAQQSGVAGQTAVAPPPMPMFTALRLEANKASASVREGHEALERIERLLA